MTVELSEIPKGECLLIDCEQLMEVVRRVQAEGGAHVIVGTMAAYVCRQIVGCKIAQPDVYPEPEPTPVAVRQSIC